MRFSTLEATPNKFHLYLDCDKALYYVYDALKGERSMGCYTRKELADDVVDSKNKKYNEVWKKETTNELNIQETVEEITTENTGSSTEEDIQTQS